MKRHALSVIFAVVCCGFLAGCSDAPQANGFGPIPHEKEMEDMIDKGE